MTAQIPDSIRLNNEDHELLTNPLEHYLHTMDSRPHFAFMATSCWRRYTAEWEVKEQHLYLVGIDALIADAEYEFTRGLPSALGKEWRPRKATLEDIFPGVPGPIAASWYSGPLRIPVGDLVHYVHFGYASQFKEELILTTQKGRIIGEERLSHDNIRHQQKLRDLSARGGFTDYFELGLDPKRLFREQPPDDPA